MLRITFFRRKCIGCNACVEAAPDRWRVSVKDGRCTLVEGKAQQKAPDVFQALICDDEHERNEIAAANCPVNVIRLEMV